MDHSKIRVIVVDDESAIRASLAGYLEDFEFDVSSAGSAEEALEMLEKEPFHVAIIDLRLPGMSGDALIVEAHRMVPSMRFIIHTGSAAFHLPEELRCAGVLGDHIFLKPMADMTSMVEAVEELMVGKNKGVKSKG